MADESVSIDDTAQTSDVKRMCRREAKWGEAATESPGNRIKTTNQCTQGEKISKEFRPKLGDADHPLASDCRDDGLIIELLLPLCTLPTNKYIEPFRDILRGKFFAHLFLRSTQFLPHSSHGRVIQT